MFRKMTVTAVVVLVLSACSFCTSYTCAEESKYVDAQTRVSFYHQYMQDNGVYDKYYTGKTYWDNQLMNRYGIAISDKLANGNTTTTPHISGRGCALLSFGHAIQWLSGKASSDRQIEILYELLQQNNNPPIADDTYANYISSHYNTSKAIYWNGQLTESILKEAFDKNGVIVFSSNGHVSTAVGYRTYNGVLYVQIVDTVCRATLTRLSDGGDSAKNYDFSGGMGAYTTNNQPNQSGGQYWIPYSVFNRLYWFRVFIPNNPYSQYYTYDAKTKGFYRAVSGSGAIKEYPYSGSKTIRTMALNVDISDLTSKDVVEVVEFVANSYEADDPGNHVFAHLSDGNFIYSGFIERLYYKIRDVSYTVTCTQTDIKNYPFYDASNKRLLSPPVQLKLIAEYKNMRGNIWYEVEGGGFVNENNVKNFQQIVTLELQEGSTWAGDKNNRSGYPSGNLNVGQAFGLRGIINSSENIASVEARVIVAGTDQDALPKVTVYPNSTTLNIQYSDINELLVFNNLANGSFVYKVKATTASGVTKTLIESAFTVGTGVPPAELPVGVTIECFDTVFYDQVYNYILEDHAQVPLGGWAYPGNYEVAWESSNPAVATVPNPYMEIVGVGTAVIKCYCVDYPDVYAKFTVEVTSSNPEPTDEYEYAVFPNGTVYVSQVAYGGYSHANYNVTDIVPDGDVYAPFTGTIRYKDDTWGYVVLESNSKVHYADGSLDYMSIGFMHDNNISDLWVGKTIQKGEAFYQKGVKSPDNNVTGPHVHIVVMRGQLSNYSYYYSRSGNVYLFDAFYLTSSTHIAQSGYDISKWKYLNSQTPTPSTEKISISLENASPATGLPKTAGTGVPYPHMPVYQSFGLRGVITAFETIESVTATIFNITGQYQDASVTINPNSTTVNIQYSDINNNLLFSHFNAGAYRYTVVVTTVSGYTEMVIDAAYSIGDYDPCGHQYAWEIVEQPTCTSLGIRQQVCSLCGHPGETEEIDMLAHTPGGWVVVQEPTTTQDGIREHLCSVCGNVIESEIIPLYFTPITSIDPILGNSTTFHPGSTGTFSAKVYPENATKKDVVWYSSDPYVFALEQTGSYQALAIGSAYVYCYAVDDSEVMSPAIQVTVAHNLNWVTTVEPSAIKNGQRQCVCSECGYVDEIDIIPSFTSELMENPDFVTPARLSLIGTEAFSGVPAVLIKLSENVVEIEHRAFAECSSLRQIYIPAATEVISDTAFDNTAGSNVTIVGYRNTEAQRYADRNHIPFMALDPEPQLSGWVLITDVPENVEIVNTKTQYSYRDKNVASYTEWSDWSPWQNDQEAIPDNNLKQEEAATKYRWWAALCLRCMSNNPYHATNCKACGSYLGNAGTDWISVLAFSDDTSGTQTILGRSQGRYFDGKPYWYMDLGVGYRYRTRSIIYDWGAWSTWSETAVDASETKEVRTQTLVQYLIYE